MKAINYFVLNIICISVFISCKPDEQQESNLDSATKDYFEIRDNYKFIFTESSDTTISIEYTSSGFNNSRANPDIENTEIMFYDLNANVKPKYTIRCQAGGGEFKDQIALVTFYDDSTYIGPVFYNVNGDFVPGQKTGDSVLIHSSYNLNGVVYPDVIRVKMFAHLKYKEAYFAKGLGLIGLRLKNNKLIYVKRYRKS